MHTYTAPGANEVDDDACKAIAKEACMTRVARAQRPLGEDGPLFFAAALVARDDLLGVVVARIEPPFAPGPGQLSMFQAFADTVAIGLSNAHLYDQSMRSAATSSALLQEMHHRVRNNLQIVASLLSIQARAANVDAVSRPLLEAVARIQSIASIHDLMSRADVECASLQTIAETVANEASINVVPPGLTVRFDIDAGDIQIPSNHAMVLGLLINECITNAVVHGFPGRASGTIRVSTVRTNGYVELAVTDDGVGIETSEDGNGVKSSGLGTRIAARIAESDLRGSFWIEPAVPVGTAARIRFPVATDVAVSADP
jgi:two-component sensor histidine kinase